MPRISLVEAYNNRDVIAWLVKHQDAIDEMMNILQNVNPDGDLTNIVLKTGDQTIDGVKTFIGKIVANCDIIQNGAAYETHAEQLFTKNDYIVMRDGALGGLQPGEFSGFRVNRYDSVHDGHLVMDSSGVARVGDVGDEQPLATRDEAAGMTDGAIVTWDAANQKIIAAASNVGTDETPIKIVGGQAVAVANALQTKLTDIQVSTPDITVNTTDFGWGVCRYSQYGKVVFVELWEMNVLAANYSQKTIVSGLPKSSVYSACMLSTSNGSGITGLAYITPGSTQIDMNGNSGYGMSYGQIIYIAE